MGFLNILTSKCSSLSFCKEPAAPANAEHQSDGIHYDECSYTFQWWDVPGVSLASSSSKITGGFTVLLKYLLYLQVGNNRLFRLFHSPMGREGWESISPLWSFPLSALSPPPFHLPGRSSVKEASWSIKRMLKPQVDWLGKHTFTNIRFQVCNIISCSAA